MTRTQIQLNEYYGTLDELSKRAIITWFQYSVEYHMLLGAENVSSDLFNASERGRLADSMAVIELNYPNVFITLTDINSEITLRSNLLEMLKQTQVYASTIQPITKWAWDCPICNYFNEEADDPRKDEEIQCQNPNCKIHFDLITNG